MGRSLSHTKSSHFQKELSFKKVPLVYWCCVLMLAGDKTVELSHTVKVVEKWSCVMFSLSCVGNAVAVRHQSRAAGLTPKNNSTSNAVSFPWFVLLFQTWSLCSCLDSVIIHACVCTVWAHWSRDMKYMSIWHVRKHNLNFFALMSELDHHDNLYSWMFLKVYATATAVLSWPWSITVSCRT